MKGVNADFLIETNVVQHINTYQLLWFEHDVRMNEVSMQRSAGVKEVSDFVCFQRTKKR